MSPSRLLLAALTAALTLPACSQTGNPSASATPRHHSILCCSTNTNAGSIAIIRDGGQVWTHPVAEPANDGWLLSNGNVVYAHKSGATEVTPDHKIVWDHKCPAGYEIHAVQPLPNHRMMVMQGGPVPHILEIDANTDTIERDIVLPTNSMFREIRKTAAGTYIVPHFNQNKVSEYNDQGREIWSAPAQTPWAAVRLKNGNTLISGGGSKYVREIDPKGATVWEVKGDDLPGNPLLFPNEVLRLANGNTIICNWTGHNPETWNKANQLVEVTPDKKVVWVFNDWKDANSISAAQILDDPGIAERAEIQR